MKRFLLLSASSFLLSAILAISSFAQSALDYPELQVTPRASKRLQMEMENERGIDLTRRLPMQMSAMTTFIAGIMQLSNVDTGSDVNKKSPMAGLLVGGVWLATNYFLGNTYTPYSDAYNEIGKMPVKSKRDDLTRERLAEEAINSAGSLDRKLSWLSFLTNAGAGIYMASNAKADTISSLTNILAVAASITPLLFDSRWEIIKKEHKNYKKKIYGPIASTTLFQDPVSKKLTPGMMLSLNF